MKFSIITPTYRRKESLVRAVASVLRETYADWELIIINDSPSDTSYNEFATSINDSRIHYHVNEINKGVNYSRNLGLEKVSADSKWIIFLDDDDYLAPDALQTFHDLIMHHQNTKWFITNRAFKNGKPVTIAPKSDTTYLYALSYLVFKRIKGDVTHCIETKLLIHNHITFSNYVKQAEEWFFFYQVGLHTKMYYHDHNSTITDGYNSHTGLNFRKRTKGDRFEALSQLTYEAIHKRIIRPTFIVYIFLRLIAIFVR